MFAAYLNISVSAIRKWETGEKSNISAFLLTGVTQILKIFHDFWALL